MPERIPKSIAKKVVFRAIASADHFTPTTGKTIAITISKNGATSFSNPAAGATNATEMASGFYKFDLGTGDTDTGGPLAWRAAGTGCDDIGDVYEVVNATNAGFSALPDVASGSAGAVIVSGTGTAALSVSGGTAKADLDTIKTQAVTAAAGVTFPSSIASPTNITAGTLTTVTTATNLTNLPAIPANWLTAAGIATDAVQKIVDATWSEDVSTYGASTAGFALDAAGNDVAALAIQIGDIFNFTSGLTFTVANQLDVNVLDWKSATAPAMTGDAFARLGAPATTTISADIAAMLASALTAAGVRTAVGLASANLDTQLSDLPTAAENADKLLGRNQAGGSDGGRTVSQGFYGIRNRFGYPGGVYTVYENDDTTPSWTGAVTTDPAAAPVIGMDPA